MTDTATSAGDQRGAEPRMVAAEPLSETPGAAGHGQRNRTIGPSGYRSRRLGQMSGRVREEESNGFEKGKEDRVDSLHPFLCDSLKGT